MRRIFLAFLIILLFVSGVGAVYGPNFIPTMTSDTLPAGNSSIASTSYSGYPAYKAFDHDNSTDANGWLSNSVSTGYVQINLSSGHVLSQYTIYGIFQTGQESRAPQAWQMNASNDGSTWTTLDTQSSVYWPASLTAHKTYPISNTNSYSYYRMVITQNNGSAFVAVKEIEMQSSMGSAPVANFTSSAPIGAFTLYNITFTDISTNTPTSWLWQFGDGNTSAVQNPVYHYIAAGTYYVNLTATNSYGSSNKTMIQTVVNPSGAIANFTQSPNPSAVGEAVIFNDTSANNPTAWDWIFGDGSANVTTQNATHTYAASGNYSVFLRASSVFGTSTKQSFHVVNNASGFNQQDIVMDPINLLTIHFTSTTTNAIIPVVMVTTSDGQTNTTTVGVASFYVPYSTIIVFPSSVGYLSTSHSYVVDQNMDVTIQLTPVSPTQAQNSNVIWTPPQVIFQVIDANQNPIIGTPVYAHADMTTLPGGLTGALTTMENTYGLSQDSALQILNKSTNYIGETDSSGSVVFMMVPVIRYEVTAVDTSGANYTLNIMPMGSYYQIKTDNATSQSQAALVLSDQNLYNGQSIFISNFTEPNSSYGTMNNYIYDATENTNGANCWFTILENGSIWWENRSWGYGSGLQILNKTVPIVAYQQWKWGCTTT